MAEEETVEEVGSFSCPFCTGEVTGFTGERAGLLHTTPPCITFMALEPADFVDQAMRKRANDRR